MKVIADLCVVPMGIGVSVSKEVAACERVLAEAGLKTNLHAYGTNIEGEWDEVFAAIKRCHEVVHALGAPRISSSLRFGTRIDRPQTIADKIRSVEQKRGAEAPARKETKKAPSGRKRPGYRKIPTGPPQKRKNYAAASSSFPIVWRSGSRCTRAAMGTKQATRCCVSSRNL
jgi:uncharacterized protein (TIGR00106 family)